MITGFIRESLRKRALWLPNRIYIVVLLLSLKYNEIILYVVILKERKKQNKTKQNKTKQKKNKQKIKK